jgi:hypothetical protein
VRPLARHQGLAARGREKTKIQWNLAPVQNLEFWRYKRQNSTLQARKEPENRDFCGLLTAKIHNLNRLLCRTVHNAEKRAMTA